jgi:hypothetical protein
MGIRARDACCAGLLALSALAASAQTPPPRPWPDTSRGIHVFNDQLADGMSEALVRFAATHYAGTQKMTRTEADRLRTVTPGFLILHYRLGVGLGYRTTTGSCQPTGPWIGIVEGNDWVTEWPGDSRVATSWFFPYAGQPRVLNCDWGWYLAELNDPAWRAFWRDEVLRQATANDNDGVFMDSLSVPNYLGGGSFRPALPDVDRTFEQAWTGRIESWLTWLRSQLPTLYLVPNAGSWITTRDETTYASAHGLMIEGFAIEADDSPYNLEDWQLQMNRVLAATARGQAIIGQSYALGARERMFALGSYLLVRGPRTYLNLEMDYAPEWWPEYDLPVGRAMEAAPGSIDALYDAPAGIYRRVFDTGLVLVNPTSPWDGTAVTRTVSLGTTYYLAETSGGGEVPESGVPTGSVSYRPVTSVTLPPFSAVVLFTTATPGGDAGDRDDDGLPDDWERQFGLNADGGAGADGPAGDPDGDGRTNLQEYEDGSHPRGLHRRYLAEGATRPLFETRLALLNTGDTTGHVLLRFQRANATTVNLPVEVPARRRATVDIGSVSGLETAEFSTLVESDTVVVVDRTMWWDRAQAFGAHAEGALPAPSRTWFLAEGATHSGFQLFYLLQNPGAATARVRIRYLRQDAAPLEKTYELPAASRTNVWVNHEQFAGLAKALASCEVSAAVDVLDGPPVVVERAMYLDVAGQPFGAGHESAGVTAAATGWFFAEGATGPYFDTFVLVANATSADAHLEAIYLMPDGTSVTVPRVVKANSRSTIWIDYEAAPLSDTAVSTLIRSVDGTPVVAERAMWWPGTGSWHEAHGSPGATATGTRWALAEGEVGGARNVATYILVANTSTAGASVRVELRFEDGTAAARTFAMAGQSRFNVDVGAEFPDADGRRFGAFVTSLGASAAPIVVERAIYWDAAGQHWAAGTNALATRLQ